MSATDRSAVIQQQIRRNREGVARAQATVKQIAETLQRSDRTEREVLPRLRRAGLAR